MKSKIQKERVNDGTGFLPTIPLTEVDLAVIATRIRQASRPGKREDGTRVHVHYQAFGTPSSLSKREALRAAELGLDRDRYTGRVSRVWKALDGSLCIRIWVELERKHRYRTLNATKGKIFKYGRVT